MPTSIPDDVLQRDIFLRTAVLWNYRKSVISSNYVLMTSKVFPRQDWCARAAAIKFLFTPTSEIFYSKTLILEIVDMVDTVLS